jgi:hypothetical protein
MIRRSMLLLLAFAGARAAFAQQLVCPTSPSVSGKACETFHFHVQMYRPDTRVFEMYYGINQFASQAACDQARDAQMKGNAAIVDFYRKVQNNQQVQVDRFGPCHCDMSTERSSSYFLTDLQRATQIRMAEEIRRRVRERLLDAKLSSDSELVRGIYPLAPVNPVLNGPRLTRMPAPAPAASISNASSDLRARRLVQTAQSSSSSFDLPLAQIGVSGVAAGGTATADASPVVTATTTAAPAAAQQQPAAATSTVAPAVQPPAAATSTVAPAVQPPAAATSTVVPAVQQPAAATSTVAPPVQQPAAATSTVVPAVQQPAAAISTVVPAVQQPAAAISTVAAPPATVTASNSADSIPIVPSPSGSEANDPDAFIVFETQRIQGVLKAGSATTDDSTRSKILDACIQRLQVLSNLRSLIQGSGARSRVALAAISARDESGRIALVTKLFGSDVASHWATKEAAGVVMAPNPDLDNEPEKVLRDSSQQFSEAQRRRALFIFLERGPATEDQQLWLIPMIEQFVQ